MLRVLGSWFLAAALAAPAPAPAPAPASSPIVDTTAPQDEGVRRVVGVVTFEGSSEHAARLSRALSSALRRRGHSSRGGQSLQQVQSQLGCTDYQPACMARAAALFDAELVVYGTLREQGQVHQLEMFLLDAGRAEVQAHVSAAIPAYDLSDGSIENKAVDLLAQLWPLPTTQVEAEPASSVPFPGIATPPPEPAEKGKLRWGRQQPIPRWKWAAFGASAGTMVVGTVLASVGAARLRPGGPLERELSKEADESLVDTDADGNPTPANDIDRSQGGDLCAIAEAPPPGEADRVTNRDVAAVCRQARMWTGVANAGIVTAVVGLVGVVTFTTLMFVHRERPGARARIRPRMGGLAVTF